MAGYSYIKNSRHIRYVLFFMTLFVIIASIKVYLNNFSIESNIQDSMDKIDDTYSQLNFNKKFYSNYLSGTDIVVYFKSHENNILMENEKIVKLNEILVLTGGTEIQTDELSEIKKKTEIVDLTNPKDAWKYFLNDKVSKIK